MDRLVPSELLHFLYHLACLSLKVNDQRYCPAVNSTPAHKLYSMASFLIKATSETTAGTEKLIKEQRTKPHGFNTCNDSAALSRFKSELKVSDTLKKVCKLWRVWRVSRMKQVK